MKTLSEKSFLMACANNFTEKHTIREQLCCGISIVF